MKVTVKVPATTANLGPGFDCLGLALPIYNEITVEETVMPGSGIEINIIEDSETYDILSIPKAGNVKHMKENIAAKNIKLTADEIKLIDNDFPQPTEKKPLAMI